MSLIGNKKSISPGSIGAKIKKYREFKGWSQKELGIECGFSPSTADVRIGQYENCKKIPRENALNNLSAALGVDVEVFFNADMFSYKTMCHALFDMEDFHGLHPVKIDDEYYLEFDCITKEVYQDFLSEWYVIHQKCLPNECDSDEEKERKAIEYAFWRGRYPFKSDGEIYEKMRDLLRMNQLMKEMADLKEKMKSYNET